jgi:glutamyl-tRNA reductase
LADVALDEAAERSGAIAGRPLLIVGAGKMGHLVAVAAAGRGARIAVASRTADRAERLAREVGGRAVPFDPGPAGLGDVSATVVALLGGWPIGRRTAAALIEGSFPIIDLSTMPVLPMRVRAPLGRRYVSADDLARPTRGVRSSGTDQRLLALVDAAVEEFVVWSAGHYGRTVASVLSARVDAVRRSELDALWQRESTVDSATREAVERMTRHLAERWLREPLERLGRDADGRQAAAARELFSL